LVVSAASGCSSSDKSGGTCHVQEYDIQADFKQSKSYCASKADCDAFCASVAGQQSYPGCSYEDSKYCGSGSLPTPKVQRVCALYQSIVCGGGPDSFEPHCDTSCTEKAGSSDYDASTDCFTKYKGPIVEGTTCAEALAKLP
jgi:hypothetical protein